MLLAHVQHACTTVHACTGTGIGTALVPVLLATGGTGPDPPHAYDASSDLHMMACDIDVDHVPTSIGVFPMARTLDCIGNAPQLQVEREILGENIGSESFLAGSKRIFVAEKAGKG